MKDPQVEWSKQLKKREEELYAYYRSKARALLIRKGATDLLPMLGLDREEDTSV